MEPDVLRRRVVASSKAEGQKILVMSQPGIGDHGQLLPAQNMAVIAVGTSPLVIGPVQGDPDQAFARGQPERPMGVGAGGIEFRREVAKACLITQVHQATAILRDQAASPLCPSTRIRSAPGTTLYTEPSNGARSCAEQVSDMPSTWQIPLPGPHAHAVPSRSSASE